VRKGRPLKGRERERGKREGKEDISRDRVDSGSTGRSPRTERDTPTRNERKESRFDAMGDKINGLDALLDE
jgi:hypothetical protein